MRPLLLIVTLAVVFSSISCSRSKEENNYTRVESEDAAMNAAIAKAKATTDDFIQAFRARKPESRNYFVKKPYPTPAGGQEHMWIEVMEEENGVLKGYVANEAEETHEVKMGQQVSLSISEITDWKYEQGHKLIGGFTIRYFIEKMSPQEREAFLKESGFEL
jgi:uncharacterized protein YegJ (DUF2314 family)